MTDLPEEAHHPGTGRGGRARCRHLKAVTLDELLFDYGPKSTAALHTRQLADQIFIAMKEAQAT